MLFQQCANMDANKSTGSLSTHQIKSTGIEVRSKNALKELMAVFPKVVNDITDVEGKNKIPEVTKWYEKVLHSNVPHGKRNRGMAVVMAYIMNEDPAKLTPKNMKLANMMGWCVEMLQAFFLVIDDIMDSSETRRGMPCWYKNPGVGLNGINDAILLEHGIYSILKKHFSDHPCYLQMLELFHDITLKTSMGQALDCFSLKDGRPDINAFTMERYSTIVKYKAAYYSFVLPVRLGMYLAGIVDPVMHKQAEKVLLEIGHFFQVQDDYLDDFGDEGVTGKAGSDIREGKCSWLIVVALQKATPGQRMVFRDNYGRSDQRSIEAVRNLYDVLEIQKAYLTYEEETYNLISTQIKQLPKDLPHGLFFKLLDVLYKRKS